MPDETHIEEFNTDLGQYFDMAQSMDEHDSVLDECLVLNQIKDLSDYRYAIEEDVDEGGMKKIYLTRDKLTNRHIAMAKMKDYKSIKSVEKFISEARLTALLEHPNIMPVHDVGVDEEGHPFFTMKFVEGENLKDLIKRIENGAEEDYPLSALLNIFLKVCDAVDFAHSKGILHLDLKPDNIQISDYGEVLLCDWGLARQMKKGNDDYESQDDMVENIINISKTADGVIKGTPGYMAPEQADPSQSKKSIQTDIYSLGAILYAILTRRLPVSGGSVQDVLRKTARGKIIPPSERRSDLDIPPGLEAVVLKAMSRNPVHRYRSVGHLIKEIVAYQQGFATQAESAGLLTQLKLVYKRNKVQVLTAIGVTAFIVVLTIFFMLQLNQRVVEAEAAKKDALEQKSKAEKAGEEALKQTEKASAANKLLGPRLYEKAVDQFKKGEFDAALESVDLSIKASPDSKESWFFLGVIKLSRLEFAEAYKCFKKAEVPEKFYLYTISEKFSEIVGPSNRKLKIRQVIVLLSNIYHYREKMEYRISFNNAVLQKIKSIYSKEECAEIVKGAFKAVYENKKFVEIIKDGELYNVIFPPGQVRFAQLLEALPIKKLDMSKSGLSSTYYIRFISAESINLSGTKVEEVGYLGRISDLKELDIRNTKVTVIKGLQKTNIEKFYLNENISNIEALLKMPSLRDISAPEGVYPKLENRKYKKRFNIIFNKK